MFVLKIIFGLAVIWLIAKFRKFYARRRTLTKKFDVLPGATPSPFHPIFDTINMMIVNRFSIKRDSMDSFVWVYELARANCRVFQDLGLFRWYLGHKPVVITFAPENVEAILQSTTVVDKSYEYRVFEPLLGEGLVTSRRPKWNYRRKLLTPAFHFRILNDFLPVMNQEATKLVKKLNNVKYTRSFELSSVIALCTLDTICETAMGVNMDCQANEHLDYVKALHEVGEISVARMVRPWLWPDIIFWNTKLGKRCAAAIKIMHDFTRGVIVDRKAVWERMLAASSQERNANGSSGEASGENRKPAKVTFSDVVDSQNFESATSRLAFLDLLMHQHLVENTMTLEDIREEVDTFMFAGHDTTAVNITWALYLLGLNEEIQDKVRAELDEVFADADQDEYEVPDYDGSFHLHERLYVADVTNEQLAQMKYLELVIKETLRMFPSIPYVARQITEDIVIGGKYLVPEGSTCVVFIHALHNNPKVYENPEKFDPERFLPEKVSKRHPFAYLPFSAGPRNCIGQKYGKMEVKVILAKIIRNYYVKTVQERDKLRLVGELVLRSIDGVYVKLTPRFRG
jgi:cytochrome P450 family 4 subfamily V